MIAKDKWYGNESIRQAKAIVRIEDVNVTAEDEEMAEQCINGERAIQECLPPLVQAGKHPYSSFGDYFVPRTELLENRFGYRSNDDQAALETLTGRFSFLRIALLLSGKEKVETDQFSLETLQHIHRHLFQDVYPWAGMVRTFGMRKGDCSFCPGDYITEQGRYIASLFVKAGPWGDMDKEQFSSTITKLFNQVDDLHPFREGNGRTQRTFFLLFSRHEGWDLDYTLFSPQAQVDASIKALFGDERPMHDQFYAMAKRMERDNQTD